MISFTVHGTPKPAGSKRAFVNRKTGRAIVTDMSGKPGKDWRADIQHAYIAAAGTRAHSSEAVTPPPLLDEALYLEVVFQLERPAAHYGRTGALNAAGKRRPYPSIAPDTTKLLRAVEDALNGVAWKDDSRIVCQFARKVYATRAGATITIMPMTELEARYPKEEP